MKHLKNAIVVIMVLGGSTNAVLHLIAIAKSVGVELHQDDFQTISDKVPVLADFKPSGKYLMQELHNHGGLPAIMRYLLDKGLLHGGCMTVTGKTIAENLQDIKPLISTHRIYLSTGKTTQGHGTFTNIIWQPRGKRQRGKDQR